jgi:hypothetical protein
MLDNRLLATRKHRHGSAHLRLAADHAKVLEGWVLDLSPANVRPAAGEADRSGADEAIVDVERQVREVSSRAMEDSKRRDAHAVQDEVSRELRRAVLARDRPPRSTPVNHTVAEALLVLLNACVDELSGSGTPGAEHDMWMDEEAALLWTLLQLCGSSGRVEGSGSPLMRSIEVIGGPDASEAEIEDAQTLSGFVAQLEELAGRLTAHAAKADGSESGSIATASTMEPSARTVTGSSLASRLESDRVPGVDASAPQSAERAHELRLVVQQLAGVNESLRCELQAENQRSSNEESSAADSMREAKERYQRLSSEMADLSSKRERLKAEATRLRGERREAHAGVEVELLKLHSAKEELAEERSVRRRLEDALRRANAAPSAAAAAIALEEERCLQRLRAELATTYASLATKLAAVPPEEDHQSEVERKAASLRRSLQELEAENAALRVTADLVSHAEAGNGAGEGPRELSRNPTYARLQDGRQVELTSKVERQDREIAELRERLQKSESRQAEMRQERRASHTSMATEDAG